MKKFVLLLAFLPMSILAGECNYDSTQVELTRCAISNFSKSHDLLERHVGRLEHCLSIELAPSHLRWKNAEKDRCTREVEPGGSIYAQLFYACLLEGTEKRIQKVMQDAPTCFK